MMRPGNSSSTVGRPSDSPRGRAIVSELDSARYVSLTTFRRDGTPKASPVWPTGNNGVYRFYTGANSWKVKRLRNNPNVELRVCDMRGRVEPHTFVHHGTPLMLDDNATLDEVKVAILEKYRWQARLVLLTDAIKDRLGRGDEPVTVEIHVTG